VIAINKVFGKKDWTVYSKKDRDICGNVFLMPAGLEEE
jgi:hypothetical protein